MAATITMPNVLPARPWTKIFLTLSPPCNHILVNHRWLLARLSLSPSTYFLMQTSQVQMKRVSEHRTRQTFQSNQLCCLVLVRAEFGLRRHTHCGAPYTVFGQIWNLANAMLLF